MSNKYESDCKAIHESCGKLETTVRILSRYKPTMERKEIKEAYKAIYGEDLLTHLHKLKLKFKNEDSKYMVKTCEGLYLWMCDPWERDAFLAKEAIEQNETDYMALIEIFVGRKSSHFLMIKQAYQTRVKRGIDQDIVTFELPHPYQRILVALSTYHKAKCDAMRFYQTGEGSSGFINEAVVLELLSKRSIPHLRLTFSSYKRIYGHSYTKQLKKAHSTQFEDAIRNLVDCIQDPPKYYAKMLKGSMSNGDPNKGSLCG